MVIPSLELVGELSAIPFFFAGALPKRVRTNPPTFSGERMSDSLRLPWITTSEPFLSHSDDFPLSWYTAQQPFKSLVSGLIEVQRRVDGAHVVPL
jgi:hypothetical protein